MKGICDVMGCKNVASIGYSTERAEFCDRHWKMYQEQKPIKLKRGRRVIRIAVVRSEGPPPSAWGTTPPQEVKAVAKQTDFTHRWEKFLPR